MKKKIMGLVMALLLLLVSCAQAGGPKDQVDKLFKAAQDLDTLAIRNMIYDKNPYLEEELDQIFDMTLENPEDSFIQALQDYYKEAAKKISYRITEVKVDGDNAQVVVQVSYVDSTNFLIELFGGIFQGHLTDEDFEEEAFMLELIGEIMPVELVASLETELEFRLVQEEGQWFFNDMDDGFVDVLTAGLITAIMNLDF